MDYLFDSWKGELEAKVQLVRYTEWKDGEREKRKARNGEVSKERKKHSGVL